MKLTNDELREIEERAEKATPGPWRIGKYTDLIAPDQFGGEQVVAREIGTDSSAKFIVSSRTDIPRLLAHIKALEDAYLCEVAGIQTLMDLRADQYNQRIDAYEEMAKRADERIKMLEEENERYKETLSVIVRHDAGRSTLENRTNAEMVYVYEADKALKGADNQ